MPSTTSNYGWSYPISTDDLNAGATTIGSLATGVDSTLYANLTSLSSSLSSEATTRGNADNALNAAKPDSNYNYIDGAVAQTTTTNASGEITIGWPAWDSVWIGRDNTSTRPAVFMPHPTDIYKIVVYYPNGTGQLALCASRSVSFTAIRIYN